MYGGGGSKKKIENMKKKKFQLALFSPLRRWTGNKTLFTGGLGQKEGQMHSCNVVVCFWEEGIRCFSVQGRIQKYVLMKDAQNYCHVSEKI